MIRILHLTDFHLNKRTLRDWNDFYKDALFEKLNEINLENKIDLVAFTGDLIDKGGKDFENTKNGFIEFKNNIIEPILACLNLDISKFIICPGNHDINRFADEKMEENGIKATLINSDETIDFINNAERKKTFKYIERIKQYKEFEYSLYESVTEEKLHDIFKFSIKFKVGDKLIGISSLNSSWRCYDDDDFKNILIGENQLNNNYKFIEKCDVKIALMHHQLDWIKDFENKVINSHINKNYDLILSGHVHEQMSSMSTGFTGTCFHNVSPSGLNQIRSNNIDFVNGFTIIDYNNNVSCNYYKYNHSQKKFVDNTDIIDNGKKTFPKPIIESENDLQSYREAIKNIKEDHFGEMNGHFIKGKNQNIDIDLKTAFIYPPIDDGGSFYQEKQTNTSFQEIINSKDHFLFLGPQESGKKSLLYRIIVEYVEDFDVYSQIPVFIDFNEIKNKEFITIIKEYTRLSSEKIKSILLKGNITLLLDNINFHESRNFSSQINKLHKFWKDYPKVRIVGTYEHENITILPSEIIQHNKIPFSYHYVRGLKTKEIKQIMRQWLPSDDVIKNEENLEKLVNTFSSYHLPNNALSVHLYLWSIENSDKKPINQAVLMEIYVELILEKLNKENIYRSNFDFTNKIQLIAMIAEKIIKQEELKKNNFTISYTEFYNIIRDYLRNDVGFSFDENIIIEYLLDRKIFTKNNRNEVKFSQVCFMHFFVAKRMQNNSEFKSYILDESRYFNYPKEIDYYTGLVRSDIETFNLLYKRFQDLFYPMEFILNSIDIDEYFNIELKNNDQNKEEIAPIARNVEIAKIKENRPTNETIERKFDEQLERVSKQRKEVKGKNHIDFDRMMLIMSNVLRNSEGIEDLELKKNAYKDIIKHNLTYSVLYTQLLVKYVIEFQKLPPSIPKNISLEDVLKNIPYHMQRAIYTHLGTQKLSSVILNKINSDNYGGTNSEIEKFLSVGLYSDIQGHEFDQHLRKFIKSSNTIPVQNYLLYKLTEYLHKRSKDGSKNEELYLDLISDLKIRSQKLPKRMKERLMKDLLERKNKMSKFFRLE